MFSVLGAEKSLSEKQKGVKFVWIAKKKLIDLE